MPEESNPIEDISLLSLLPENVRELITKKNIRNPPWADISDFGMTAIIDISGYSKLTSRLKAIYGNDGGAKIKELLNPPIIQIIKRVKTSQGSIVKFSGDAIIASCSEEECQLVSTGTKTPTISMLERASTTSNRLYTAATRRLSMKPVTETVVTTTISARRLSANLTTQNRQISILASLKESTSIVQSKSVTDIIPSINFKLHPLKIHIGLGFGATSHIYVGDGYAPSLSSKYRMEYFIAGESMKFAAEFLALGTEGDFVFSPELVNFLAINIQNEIIKYAELKMTQGLKYRNISSSTYEGVFDLQNPLTTRIAELLNDASISAKVKVHRSFKVSKPQMARSVAFMDDSIRRLVQNHVFEYIRPELALSDMSMAVSSGYVAVNSKSVKSLVRSVSFRDTGRVTTAKSKSSIPDSKNLLQKEKSVGETSLFKKKFKHH
ncbi:hypothetical protein HK100_001184 [Physocladia obscura]|uniref:Uncharacterized protein n=1 Tax=Physocladia obscura TaxID=109957 RepID=A0AAD5SX57_9FUNG|nr:hypothetical protein HK100_001184 [Physocladia obscura]